METNHRQGRPGAGERALQRAHAQRLLLTLAGICRELRTRGMGRAAHAAYQRVEKELRRLAARKA